MTSRELVANTLSGKNTGRAPRQLWYLPWAEMYHPDGLMKIKKDFPNDIINIGAGLSVHPKTEGDPHEIGTYVDAWGCVFTNSQRGVIGEVKRPIVTDDEWEDTGKVHIPEELLTFSVKDANENVKKYGGDKFTLGGCCPRPFEQLQFIRGSENLYMDVALKPKGFLDFKDKMHDFYCRLLKKWAQTDVDGLSIMDDWGSQKSLLINPKAWDELFKPMYKDYIDIAHKAGKKIFMHSDGYTLDIIPRLIDLGLDAFNTQIFCMGIGKLKQFKGKITFWGEIDWQGLLPNGTKRDIQEAVKNVYDNLYADGYCIAQCEFGAGAKPENVYTVFETWDKLTEREAL